MQGVAATLVNTAGSTVQHCYGTSQIAAAAEVLLQGKHLSPKHTDSYTNHNQLPLNSRPAQTNRPLVLSSNSNTCI
jgi:hypothetical protein